MSPKTTALNNKMLGEFFGGEKKAVGNGRYTVALGESRSGPCKRCRRMAGTHNIAGGVAQPPHHPHCKCYIK